MMKRFRTPLALAALLSLGLAAGLIYRARAHQPAVAPSSMEGPRARSEAEHRASSGQLAADGAQAIAAARIRVPGEALEAEREDDDGREVHGVVGAPAQGGQEVRVASGTGAVLAEEADDSHEDEDGDGE